MNDFERILLECRYLLSLNIGYYELAKIFQVKIDEIYDDLNVKLPKYDMDLYNRVTKVLKIKNSS